MADFPVSAADGITALNSTHTRFSSCTTGVRHFRSRHFFSLSVSLSGKMQRFITRSHVCLVATAGLVIGADNALLSHEAELRRSENAIRRLAVMELSRQGLVPTETAISRWRDERARQGEVTLVKTHA